MPYLEETSQSDHASDSVLTETSTEHSSQQVNDSPIQSSPPESPAPRRSARSTQGAPPVCFGKVLAIGLLYLRWLRHLHINRPCLSHACLMIIYCKYVDIFSSWLVFSGTEYQLKHLRRFIYSCRLHQV